MVSDTRNNLSRGLSKQSTKFRERKTYFDFKATKTLENKLTKLKTTNSKYNSSYL